MPIDNKLTNVIGAKMPFWIVNQLETRASKGALSDRSSNDNLQYLSNKTAWVRMVSSVDVSGSQDLKYFQQMDPSIKNPSDLAKNYVLFGGTSKYLQDQSYQLRWGLHNVNNQVGGAYGMLGDSEIQNYGYRPMPGITRVHIDTQGRLGSVRHATIDIKCWDKAQLDIIDALYFKLGYTMFLEWGHTYYYVNEESDKPRDLIDTDKVKSSEFMSLDPFAENISKEELMRRISENSRASYGNYDGMLGIVTNFNFSYNQEGGYDCTVRMMGLGVLGDSLKINNPSELMPLLTDEIQLLSEVLNTLNTDTNNDSLNKDLEDAKKKAEENENLQRQQYEALVKDLKGLKIQGSTYNVVPGSSLPQQRGQIPDAKLNYVGTYGAFGDVMYLSRLQEIFPLSVGYDNANVEIDQNYLLKINEIINKSREAKGFYTIGEAEAWKQINSAFDIDNIEYLKNSITGLNGRVKRRNLQGDSTSYVSYYAFNDITKDSDQSRLIQYPNTEKTETFSYIVYTDFALEIIPEIQVQLLDEILESQKNQGIVKSPIKDSETTLSVGTNISRLRQNVFIEPLRSPEILEKLNIYQRLRNAINEEELQNITLENIYITNSDSRYPDPSSAGATRASAKIFFTIRGEVIIKDVKLPVTVRNLFQNGKLIPEEKTFEVKKDLILPVYIVSDDTNIIKSFDASGISGFPVNIQKQAQTTKQQQAEAERKKKEILAEQQSALLDQISESLGMQSNLEISLRTIQVRALNSAFFQKGINNIDLSIGGRVYAFDMTKKIDYEKITRSLAVTVFSNGLYDGIIQDLIDGKIDDSQYFSSDKERLKINAKYGFATTLMGSDSSKDQIFSDLKGKEVDYKELLKAYVIPYEYSSDLVAGIKVNHPVYIPFGLLLMLLNHSCTLYDEKNSDTKSAASNFKKPIVYLDYNTKLNFFQTCPQQMSTNPWVVLMRVQCSKDEYRKLFNPNVLDKNDIIGISSTEKDKQTGAIPLFDPENGDLLSYQLPKIKVLDKNNYAGNVMNILLNIDYLVEVIRNNSFKDGTNGVYLKPFLEEVITDVNKYLGNFNAFRLNYSDKANTFQVVDDQYVFTDSEVPVQAIKPSDKEKNRTDIPLVGRYSIAKSLELKTEMGSKLANLIAISANSPGEQSQNSVNGDSVGFINDNYVDRLVPKRVSAGGEGQNLNGEKAASQQFNRSIEDFYASIQPSKDDVSQATAFLIDKISKVKNETNATRASAMIPLGINFTTDGISGMSMYQTFTVSDNLLPYTYYAKKSGAFIDGQTTFVGFVVVGLTHTIENNVWNTAVRSNMISVKDKTVFSGEVIEPKKKDEALGFAGPPKVTPNADTLRLKVAELRGEYQNRISFNPPSVNYYNQTDKLAMVGDITENLATVAGDIFEYMLKTFPDMKIIVGGGNDIFHQRSVSPHTKGRGLDFTVYPAKYQVRWKEKTSENQPTKERPDLSDPNLRTHKDMDAKVQKFVADNLKSKVYILLDEYLYPSDGATDGHYHITVY